MIGTIISHCSKSGDVQNLKRPFKDSNFSSLILVLLNYLKANGIDDIVEWQNENEYPMDIEKNEDERRRKLLTSFINLVQTLDNL